MEDILTLLDKSLTPYHAVDEVSAILERAGFIRLCEREPYRLERGKSYFVTRNGSALIAFRIGKQNGPFMICASHTDSPCLKIKHNAQSVSAGVARLETEPYGGGVWYSFFDRPLKVAGRVAVATRGGVEQKTVELGRSFVIPSVAIHFNRKVNEGFAVNAQTDLQLVAGADFDFERELSAAAGGEVLEHDLFAVPAQKPFMAGDLACAPRVDNLTSVFASVQALISSAPRGISAAYLADNEEVGSRTKQGAGSTFLKDTLRRITLAFGLDEEQHMRALASSFMMSCDNAHARHPNHPELSDPQSTVALGCGIVIKHHANQNYTTDAMSSAICKALFDRAGAKYADFHMRSDLPCGGTLGAISSMQLSIGCADIGIPQLAMHSAAETFAPADHAELVKGLCAFFGAELAGDPVKIIL